LIKRLSLRNFQAHRNLRLDLDEHVTTIVGPSDAGKSAVIRALRWLVFNRPIGTAFIREGEDRARVKLELDETSITRTRGKANTYQIGEDTPMKSFGNDVPEPVTELLRMGPLNFQAQHDAPFWFCETPGEVSRQLNQIVNLEIIDTTLAALSSRVKKANAAVEISTERLEKAKKERSEFKFARKMAKDLEEIEGLAEEVDEKGSQIDSLDGLIAKVQEAEDTLQNATTATDGANSALHAGDLYEEAVQGHKALKSILEDVAYWEENIEEYGKAIEKAEAEIAEMGEECPTCGQLMVK
jgi:exonuclease SbcC